MIETWEWKRTTLEALMFRLEEFQLAVTRLNAAGREGRSKRQSDYVILDFVAPTDMELCEDAKDLSAAGFLLRRRYRHKLYRGAPLPHDVTASCTSTDPAQQPQLYFGLCSMVHSVSST
jgi:hypothetical protein